MKTKFFLLLIPVFLFFSKISAQGCLIDGMTFSTQGQIDSFAIQYPGCTKILGVSPFGKVLRETLPTLMVYRKLIPLAETC